MRRLAILALLFAASCGDEGPPNAEYAAASEVPFADAPGTALAPRYAPPPPARGVALPPSPIRYRADDDAGAGAADEGPVAEVCGDGRLIGRPIGRIRGSNPACGIEDPVRIVQVAGVTLSNPIRVNCAAAKTFADWVERGAAPAAASELGAKLVSLRPVASYACRTRNSQRGARISEHARGNAIDVAAFRMSDGRVVDIESGWARGDSRKFLRSAWRAACGPFGTVLGPDSDRFHKDHLHLDIARHRGGPYCR